MKALQPITVNNTLKTFINFPSGNSGKLIIDIKNFSEQIDGTRESTAKRGS